MQILNLCLVVPLLSRLGLHEVRELTDLLLQLLVSSGCGPRLRCSGFRHGSLLLLCSSRRTAAFRPQNIVLRSDFLLLPLLCCLCCLLDPSPRPLRGLGNDRQPRGEGESSWRGGGSEAGR